MYADFVLPKSFTYFGNVPVETAISIQTGSDENSRFYAYRHNFHFESFYLLYIFTFI